MGALHSYLYWDLNLGRDWRIKIILNGVEWRRKGMNVTYAVTALMVNWDPVKTSHCSQVLFQKHFSLLHQCNAEPEWQKLQYLNINQPAEDTHSLLGCILDSPGLELLLNTREWTVTSVNTSFPSKHDIQPQEQRKNLRCSHWLHTHARPPAVKDAPPTFRSETQRRCPGLSALAITIGTKQNHGESFHRLRGSIQHHGGRHNVPAPRVETTCCRSISVDRRISSVQEACRAPQLTTSAVTPKQTVRGSSALQPSLFTALSPRQTEAGSVRERQCDYDVTRWPEPLILRDPLSDPERTF